MISAAFGIVMAFASFAHSAGPDVGDKYGAAGTPTPFGGREPSFDAKAQSAQTQRKVHCATCGAWYVPPMAIAPDGGFYTLWIDRSAGAPDETLYLRKMKPDGTDQWTKFVPLYSVRRRAEVSEAIRDPDIVPDSRGGVIVSWAARDENDYNLYAQRIDDTGATRWEKPALKLCTAPKDQVHVKLMVDVLGGAFAGWQDQRFGNWNVFLQHIMPAGNLDPNWNATGVQLTSQARNQYLTTLASDGLGGIWATWWDERSGRSDLFSVHVDKTTGQLTTKNPYLWRQFQ